MNLSKQTYRLFFSFLFGLMLLGAQTGMAQLSGYKYRKQIIIQAGQVPSTQTNFPVLISITDSDLANNTQNANGYDIRFAKNADGTNPLDEQIESYNASNGTLVAWVKVPNLSGSSNTPIYMFYGKPSVTTNPSTKTVWNSNFKMVQHATSSFNDATSNNNDAQVTQSTAPTPITGKIAGAGSFDGSSQFVTVPHDPSLNMAPNDRVTVSGWVWKDTKQNNYRAILQKSDKSYNLQFENGNTVMFTIYDGNYKSATAPGSFNFSLNRWNYVVGTFDGSTVRLYVNGSQIATGTANSIATTTKNVGIGENVSKTGRFLDGRLDEVRISNTARSADWIRTAYNNQNNPDNFYTIGPQQFTETTPPGAPQNVSATAIAGGNINISFDDVNESGGIQSGVASYSVKRSTTLGGTYSQIGTVTDNESASYTFTDNNATDGTTYYYVVTAVDNAGNKSNQSKEASATADGTAPQPQGAMINGANGQITYNETLNTNSVPAPGDYSIQVNGNARAVSNVVINGNKINLTLSSPVAAGDNVQGSYTVGSNPVQDQVGNNGSSLPTTTITNNTPNDHTPPGATQNVSATAKNSGNIEISFDDVDESGSGVASYSVQRSTTQGGPYTKLGTVSDDNSSNYTFTDNTTSANVTYYYILTAKDNAGNKSASSAEASATALQGYPSLQSVSVNAKDLQLMYNRDLDAGSVPAPGAYTVRVNGNTVSISQVSINNDNVNTTLGSAVSSGDNVRISYTAGAQPVQDQSGNDAPDFANQPVNNNTLPPAQTGCFGLPLLSFRNPVLVSGAAGQVGAVYRFSNVINGVDATITITKKQGAQLYQNNIDQESQGGSPKAFQPYITVTGGTRGYIDFEVQFYKAGTQIPKVLPNFALSAIDIDGDNNSLREFDGLKAGQSYTIEQTNNLNISYQDGFNIFESATATVINGIDPTATKNLAYIRYHNVNSFSIRAGNNGASTQQRLYSFDFNSCIRNNFNTPTTTTVDADVSVAKSVDKAQAVAGDKVQYTIKATNNGPQLATGLHVRDNLPPEVSFESSSASQGSYDLSSHEWTVGNLSSGQTETLTINATVNPGHVGETAQNTAAVNRLNQNDPAPGNNSSSAATAIGGIISGTVFQDITGDALSDGDSNVSDGSGDQRAAANVRVALFKDKGDGVPGGDDQLVNTVTTDANGHYEFNQPAGTYWLVVDSRSAGLSDGTSWAEQTYAGKHAYCADGTGNTTGPGNSAGPCYGGRKAGKSDNLPSTLSDGSAPFGQHLFKIQLSNNNVTDVDAGFSFNVVSNVRDGDDDGTAARSMQGSLRQFIQNANSISGKNEMRFVPAVPANASGGSGNWWSVSLSSSLPTVTDPLTTIDGKAYDLNDPTSVLDSNPGTVGAGGTVGVDELSLSKFAKKEFEINLNDHAFTINASGVVNIQNTASYNGTNGITINQVTGGSFSHDFFGARADGTKPGGSDKVSNGVQFNGSGQISLELRNNYIAYATNNGISSGNSTVSVTLMQSEIAHNALSGGPYDGADVVGSWTVRQNLLYDNGISGSSSQNGGAGFELGRGSGSSTGNIIKNNTIRDNATTGISILLKITNTTIEKNKIYNNGTANPNGPGIKVSNRGNGGNHGIKITKNSLYDNAGLGVDITTTAKGQADGATPNDGTTSNNSPNVGNDYPVFTDITVNNTSVHIKGFVGTPASKISGVQTIELFKAADDGNNNGEIIAGDGKNVPHGEGKTFLGSFATKSDGTFDATVTNSAVSGLTKNDFTATATDENGNTSEFGANRILQLGVKVSGKVYSDANHNGIKESGEDGLSGVTVVLYNPADNTCKSVQTASDGSYQYSGVADGQYKLIEAAGETTPTPGTCPPAVGNPTGYASTTADMITAPITGTPLINQNFGDYHGSKLSGTVFNDNGTNSGTANDGTQNGGETGIGQVKVKLIDSGNSTVIDQLETAAEGSYTFWIPHSSNGDPLKIVETNSTTDISTGGSKGTTGGSYTLATDRVSFTEASGNTYTGINFADVNSSSLINNGQKNLLPGTSGTFQHQFIARTDGKVSFSVSSNDNPQDVNYSVLIYRDDNGNGTIDSGESILDGDQAISVTAGEVVNLIVRVSVPQGTADGASSKVTLEAVFQFDNTSPALTQMLSQQDLLKVSTTNGGLNLHKTVDKTQAKPGETLTYTITYTNNGSNTINDLKIKDKIPAFTVYQSSSYGTLPDNLTNCSITTATASNSGSITWSFDGTLAPGNSGTVSYKVTIQN